MDIGGLLTGAGCTGVLGMNGRFGVVHWWIFVVFVVYIDRLSSVYMPLIFYDNVCVYASTINSRPRLHLNGFYLLVSVVRLHIKYTLAP